MLIDWSEQSFLLTFQRIPYAVVIQYTPYAEPMVLAGNKFQHIGYLSLQILHVDVFAVFYFVENVNSSLFVLHSSLIYDKRFRYSSPTTGCRASCRLGLDCMKDNTTYVRNIKKYLLAALYNAPTTINSYYSSLVQHDMYGDGQRGRG